MTDVIDNFIQTYQREFDFFQEAARLCAQQCERLLEGNGIRAIVSYRAKRPDRLRDKLIKRNADKNYQTLDDIRGDIVDLAGVRAALYFPGDRATFSKLIADSFDRVVPKEFPNGDRGDGKRFTGYHASHYRVSLKAEELPDLQRRYASTTIEIQVASVLMHAWSEVEHDLGYKPLSGDLSEDEHAILDMLNGLVLSGEIALERLQKAVEKRVAQSESKFSNHYELAAFLYDETKALRVPGDDSEPIMGRVNVLHTLLSRADLDTPGALRPYVDALDSDTEARPIADQIADRVLAQRPELYTDFLDIQAETGGREVALATANASEKAPTALIGEFLTQWMVFERFYRMLAREDGYNTRHLLAVTENGLSKVVEIDTRTRRRISFLRNLRNRVVHGVMIPDAATMREAITDFAAVFADLDASPDPRVKAAMRWARSGEEDPMNERLR
jgi:ppGpp synthetase/RelA/SpoT-type nucleotidyltranferase